MKCMKHLVQQVLLQIQKDYPYLDFLIPNMLRTEGNWFFHGQKTQNLPHRDTPLSHIDYYYPGRIKHTANNVNSFESMRESYFQPTYKSYHYGAPATIFFDATTQQSQGPQRRQRKRRTRNVLFLLAYLLFFRPYIQWNY